MVRALNGSSGPTSAGERIAAIDILRGLALFGVLAINLHTEFRLTIFEQFLPTPPAAPLDRIAAALLSIVVEFKAFALFSLLFGVGLAIQFERFGQRRLLLLTRRLLVLLGFGLIHLFLIWNGDILTEYAIAGLVVLPFLFGPAWLLAVAGAVSLAIYLAMPWLPLSIPFPDAAWMTTHVAEARHVYGSGTFGEILTLRITEVPVIAPLHAFVLPRTLALMLFGAWVWRTGALRKLVENRWRYLIIAAALIGLGAILMPRVWAFRIDPGPIAGSIADSLAPVVLALGYAAFVLALTASRRTRPLLAWAAPVGRMAFTNYIMQSVVLGLIFYGYGLGLMGHVGAAGGLTIAILIYIGQIGLSAWWLRRYRFGPLEWLWRSLTYGERQPWRRTAALVELAVA